jgi:sulfur carrier protein ThiS
MDYTKIFRTCYIGYIFFLLLAFIATIYFCICRDPFRRGLKTDDYRLKIKIYRVILFIAVVVVVRYLIIPMARDVKFVNSQKYEIDNGTAYSEIIRTGAFGLHRSIEVMVNGKVYEYQVIYSDKNIKKGDEVQITYLPHTTWSVVEKTDKAQNFSY